MSRRRPGSRRERLALRLPVPLMEYPFECFVAVYGVLAALTLLFVDDSVPPSLDALLPHAVVMAWAASLGLGGTTLVVGLARLNGYLLAIGLRLVSVALATFVLAYIGFAWTPSAIPGALLLGFIAALAAFRSFYLRARLAMIHRIAQVAREE